MKRPGFNGAVFAAGWLLFVTVLPSAGMHSLQQSGAIVAAVAMRSDLEAILDLLRAGADPNASQGDGMSALHWAAQNGDSNIAEVLIYAGANVEATTRLGGYTPLHLAAERGVDRLRAHLSSRGLTLTHQPPPAKLLHSTLPQVRVMLRL